MFAPIRPRPMKPMRMGRSPEAADVRRMRFHQSIGPLVANRDNRTEIDPPGRYRHGAVMGRRAAGPRFGAGSAQVAGRELQALDHVVRLGRIVAAERPDADLLGAGVLVVGGEHRRRRRDHVLEARPRTAPAPSRGPRTSARRSSRASGTPAPPRAGGCPGSAGSRAYGQLVRHLDARAGSGTGTGRRRSRRSRPARGPRPRAPVRRPGSRRRRRSASRRRSAGPRAASTREHRVGHQRAGSSRSRGRGCPASSRPGTPARCRVAVDVRTCRRIARRRPGRACPSRGARSPPTPRPASRPVAPVRRRSRCTRRSSAAGRQRPRGAGATP